MKTKDTTENICYICHQKIEIESVHNRAMCQHCGQINHLKRLQSADLKGYTALLTGGRTNIGYEIALKLLRAGAHTIITTRFPADAAMRFASETDFELWRNRLDILQCDFRNLRQVMAMIQHLNAVLPCLDILINNAAQTVRRPLEYYRNLVDMELTQQLLLPGELTSLVSFQGDVNRFAADQAALDKADAMFHPATKGKDYFPAGELDEYGNQLDKRPQNSWNSRAHEISPVELLEVQTVNSMVPYMLCAYLKPLMFRSRKARRFVINVSAMEGVFENPFKNPYHPHTNMAKAALNMLTRTIGMDYARDSIYVNSVDTGWVNNENPLWLRRQNQKKGVTPPLDPVDGAARVLDPVFCGITSEEEPLYGKFLKDFHVAPW